MHALLGHLDILNRIRGSKTEFVGLYGGTAHKDSNSTSKGPPRLVKDLNWSGIESLVWLILCTHISKVILKNVRAQETLASAITIFMGCTSVESCRGRVGSDLSYIFYHGPTPCSLRVDFQVSLSITIRRDVGFEVAPYRCHCIRNSSRARTQCSHQGSGTAGSVFLAWCYNSGIKCGSLGFLGRDCLPVLRVTPPTFASTEGMPTCLC